MELQALTAISPVDGRYRSQTGELAAYFSEYALIRYRIRVEIEYFIFLGSAGFFPLPARQKKALRDIYWRFTLEEAQQVKDRERITNHDVKAVEYLLKEMLESRGLDKKSEWVHFGLTSQDINNTAIPLLWKEAIHDLYLPAVGNLGDTLKNLAGQWEDIAMLARTHGQPASPTKLGKEIRVFTGRLEGQLRLLGTIPYSAKFGGATGNFNAHHAAFPKRNWPELADHFVNEILGLQRVQYTTQIEPYDNLCAQFDTLKRINSILIDLCRDMWAYVSMDYFRQKINKQEVGSSAMPHKINPIDFENAEGNLGVANALFEYLSSKLPVSRLQRDLTDSTVLRNIGVPFAHTILAFRSLNKGLDKLILNKSKIAEDLENNWAVVSEAIQTILRRESYPRPYEALKELTRGDVPVTRKIMHEFIESLKIKASLKKELKQITPQNYTGV
ncbi:MAG TPA: adenylosuccinate lyase [Chitinophagaceae bacterium]|nr:adenylosuccinate lyase [Chitinophagaceae bacterium]